jgi:hypothetical protein
MAYRRWTQNSTENINMQKGYFARPLPISILLHPGNSIDNERKYSKKFKFGKNPRTDKAALERDR